MIIYVCCLRLISTRPLVRLLENPDYDLEKSTKSRWECLLLLLLVQVSPLFNFLVRFDRFNSTVSLNWTALHRKYIYRKKTAQIACVGVIGKHITVLRSIYPYLQYAVNQTYKCMSILERQLNWWRTRLLHKRTKINHSPATALCKPSPHSG